MGNKSSQSSKPSQQPNQQTSQLSTRWAMESVVFVKKGREDENQQKVREDWQKSLGKFFGIHIQNRFNDQKVEESARKEIVQMLLQFQNFSRLNLDQILSLAQHKTLIKQIIASMSKIHLEYYVKKRQCVPISSILQTKITNLKSIHIEYSSPVTQQKSRRYFYEVSAYNLFKAIHQNAQLEQVKLRGVQLTCFSQFIHDLADKKAQWRQDWMKNFRVSKFFKLTVNTKISLDLQYKQKSLSFIRDLTSFVNLFQQLSEITVIIRLRQWDIVQDWRHIQYDFSECFRRMTKIEVCIFGYEYNQISNHSVSFIRALFVGLASFTQIAKLALFTVCFSSLIELNHFLAMEENLRIIFENNSINHLRLCCCKNFPVLPQIVTIQSIDFKFINFRKPTNVLGHISQAKPSLLKSIKYQDTRLSNLLPFEIEDKMFDGLQTLLVSLDSSIIINSMSPSPSNLKYLTIQSSATLQRVSHKLVNLKYLNLGHGNYSHQLISTILSPHLEEIVFVHNSFINNRGIQGIDSKWPNLRCIRLRNCTNVTDKIWNICKFSGLKQVQADNRIFGQGKNAALKLKRRGVWVIYY